MAAFSTILAGIALGASAFGAAKAATAKVPKPPAAPPPPPVPTAVNPNVADVVNTQRRKAASGGRASTILTGASGTTDAASTQRKTLIGY